jgi:uncharacterized OB-fold protein
MASKPNYLKPTNLESLVARKFWEGLRAGKFLAPRCEDCGELFFPPRSHCPECLGEGFTWEELSGKGTLYSWTELSFVQPEFDAPFLLGLIDLADGVGRVLTRISGETTAGLYIGMPVMIRISSHKDGMALYYAEPLHPDP